ncbi:MAG: HypC/HybG/HupF family hydrogenase formation chaperone [Candidatus Omnitrophica bacterium]|nr:HypC/HybG/HupF family hydrogenase formation chaperone [Candidatus Omnitrophota bacterium]
MCLGIPMEIIKIDDKKAIARTEGLKREVDLRFLKEVDIGDFVIIHAGFAIEKIDKKRAAETITLYKKLRL